MKVALVHDDLVQWGGAERVLVALSEIFPEAPIYTSVFDRDNKTLQQMFGSKKIITSFMQKIPGWKSLYKTLLPLYPIAFEQFDFSEFDLVISHTTRFAKSIITKPQTKHICYCHTPPRFLWNFSGEKVPSFLNPYFSFLRLYDQISSKRVDFWLAGSQNAQNRLKKIYDVKSEVLYPFVDLERFKNIDPFNGGYLLVISRLNEYKNVDLVIKAAVRLGIPLKIVGNGPKMDDLERLVNDLKGDNLVEFLGKLDENVLTQVISGCKALVVAAEEDFGLTPLEAQALGKGVIAYGKGGVLETVIEGETGYFFDDSTEESLSIAISKLENKEFNIDKCLKQAQTFSKQKFEQNFKKLIYNV